jgi:hypothetical protein
MKMFFNVNFLIIVPLLLNACGNKIDNNNSQTIIEEVPTEMVQNNSNLNSENFQEFWSEFRKIIIDTDLIKYETVIQIPFIISGYEDNDPQLKLSNLDSIGKLINTFLIQEGTVNFGGTWVVDSISNQQMYVNQIPTHYDFIKQKVNVENHSDYTDGKDWRRMENMVFSKNEEGWKLSLIYMNIKEW